MTIGGPMMQDGFDPGRPTTVALLPAEDHRSAVGESSLLPDPRVLWAVFRRRFWVFLLVMTSILGGLYAYLSVAPKLYSATSSVLIEPRGVDPIQPSLSESAEVLPSSDYIDTQLVVIGSLQTAAAVVKTLELVGDPEFGGNDSASPDQSEAERRQARLVASAEAVRRAVVIRRQGRTSVIEIQATSRSATQAARIANAFSQAYINLIRTAEESNDELNRAQINARLGELRVETERADNALQQYKVANGLMSAQGSTTAEQETSMLNQQLAVAKAALAERQGRLAAARQQLANGGGGDVTSALNSGTIGALRQQEADSIRSLAQLRARYGTRHPSIGPEELRLAAIQRQIQLEIDRILSSLDAEVKVAASGVQSLLASQGATRTKLAGTAAAQVGYLELGRKAAAARTIYEAFLNKSIGSAARNGIATPRATIASPALIPLAPSSPNIRLLVSLGGAFALIFGVLGVALAEFIDGGISTKQDVERRLGARYLGAIPNVGKTVTNRRRLEPPQDYIVSHPQSIFAESLRGLRASITPRGRRCPKVIAVVSALPREGKTTTAICLARTLALSGASTVLVDCDLRRHSASEILLGDNPGRLLDLIAGDVSLDDALVKDSNTDLAILGISADTEDSRDLLGGDGLANLIAALRARFEFVVIDTAPVLGLADARVAASHADSVLFLARWRKTTMRAVDSALDMLIAADVRIAGVALTLVDIKKYASTGHEDVYSYYRKFKKYYIN